jgi:hypothetical protein
MCLGVLENDSTTIKKQEKKSQKPPKLAAFYVLLARARTRAKRSKTSDVEAPAPRASFLSAGPSRGIYHRSRSPASSHSATPSSCHPPAAVQAAYGAPCQPAPRRGAARRRRCRGGAADVRAHRVPGVRGGGQRQRVRDPAVHGRHVDHHGAHRGHLLRRRHAHRLPPVSHHLSPPHARFRPLLGRLQMGQSRREKIIRART